MGFLFLCRCEYRGGWFRGELETELFGVEDDGDGAVVVNVDVHVCAEDTALNVFDAELFEFFHEVVTEGGGQVGVAGVCEVGTAALFAISEECEL